MNLIQTTILTEIMQTREVRRIEEDDGVVTAHLDLFDRVVIGRNGWQRWWAGKDLHRHGHPAVIPSDGDDVYYYRYGRLHREDGPACYGDKGGPKYYLDGKKLSTRQFKAWQKAQQ